MRKASIALILLLTVALSVGIKWLVLGGGIMKKASNLQMLIVLAVLTVAWIQAGAQTAPASTEVPVNLVLTLQGHHGADLSGVNSGNLIVTEGRESAKITNLQPLQGERAGLELFIMMDNAREISNGTQIEDIRHFILTQPATTKIGVAYMDMQGPTIAQDLTADHTLAAQAVITPLANLANGQSPYTALSQLIDKWPASNDRREVVMISTGEDATFGGSVSDKMNPYLDAVIEKAQRAGIVVFTIATGREPLHLQDEHQFISPTQNTLATVGPTGAVLGRIYLAQVAEGTGGELYYYRSSAPISFAPYLRDVSERLANQYLVSFLAKKPGLESLKVKSKVPHIDVVTAKKVYVPAGKG